MFFVPRHDLGRAASLSLRSKVNSPQIPVIKKATVLAVAWY